jgi:diacylglycerol kinase family enzyme
MKQICNSFCDVDEESVSYMLNEDLDIDSDDEMNLEIEGETVSEESCYKMSESESES